MPNVEPVEDVGTIRVLLFSVLREQIGASEIHLALPDPPTCGALLDRFEALHPFFAAYRPIVRMAVNRAYMQPETILRAGDEVALITPVSGG